MNDRVAIVGVGWSGFRPKTPDLSYKELMYEAAKRAYANANVDPRKDVDSFVTVAEDFHEGVSIFDEYVPDQLGAAMKSMQTITGRLNSSASLKAWMCRSSASWLVSANNWIQPESSSERPWRR